MGNLAGDFELGNPPVVNLPLPSIFLSNGVNHTFYISGDALATPPTVMISETPPGGGGGGRRAK